MLPAAPVEKVLMGYGPAGPPRTGLRVAYSGASSCSRAMIAGIIPRTLILMPTLSIITSTAGWFLGVRLGYLNLGFPQFWWVVAALGIVTVLTVQGLGVLLPMNLKLYFEILNPAPDHDKLKRWMRTYVRVVAVQGTMQVLIIVVMARFATGF